MSNALVAYFSPTGTTARAAKKLAEAIGADLYEITPAVPYSSEDLNWMNESSRSTREMKDPTSRPAIAGTCANMADYDTVFLGFPIWWYIAPTIINTFLEAHDFSHKTIVLFATSGGSGFGEAAAHLKPSVDVSAVIHEGKLFNGSTSAQELKRWASTFMK